MDTSIIHFHRTLQRHFLEWKLHVEEKRLCLFLKKTILLTLGSIFNEEVIEWYRSAHQWQNVRGVPECTVNGLRSKPTRSRGARRPPTRSRVPSTRRTSHRWGRSPHSSSRILLGPPRTAVVWSSAPGWESGRTLEDDGKKTNINSTRTLKARPFHVSPVWMFLQASPPPGYGDNTRLTRCDLPRVVFRGAHRFRLYILGFLADSRFEETFMTGESWTPAHRRRESVTISQLASCRRSGPLAPHVFFPVIT